MSDFEERWNKDPFSNRARLKWAEEHPLCSFFNPVGPLEKRPPKRSSGFQANSLMGIDFKVDPNAPPGKTYLMNDAYQEFHVIDARSRWQRFIDWLKHLFQLKR